MYLFIIIILIAHYFNQYYLYPKSILAKYVKTLLTILSNDLITTEHIISADFTLSLKIFFL